ncbi:PIR protein, putative [Plasmodium sp. gorilla clade G1]|nr:PIR protein, putative [Plasmodium sp. gorilla clade G1]
MKLHYTKILLFSIPFNILVTSSSNAYNNNKLYTTPQKPTTTSRLLSECDIQTSIYDNDPEMKSVKENFDRQTSQRFDEYNERMKDKRQKCKEQCDKDIQEIILKDKIGKSLAEKVEKVCLVCACGLGGGVAPVWGVVSGLWYATLSQYVSAKVLEAGIKKGIEVGLPKVTEIVTQMVEHVTEIPTIDMTKLVSSGYFTDEMSLLDIFKYIKYYMSDIMTGDKYAKYSLGIENISENPPLISLRYSLQATEVVTAVVEGKAAETTKLATTTATLNSAIIASFVAIVIIVLVMIIIYLVLRYRRKTKMKKKRKYIKLLKE